MGNRYRPVAVGRFGIRAREDIYTKELAKDYSKNKVIHQNTLTVGMGSKQIDIGILTSEDRYSVSPAYHTYRICEVDCDYLRYCLEARNADMFKRFAKRGTRQGKTIDLKRWLGYRIYLPSKERQVAVVRRLDAIERQIDNCKSMGQRLDDLVKSQFMEIFSECLGDKVSLSDVVWFQEGPGVRNYQYTAHGVKLLNVANLHDGELDISNTGRYISEEEAYGRYRHFLVEEGDLIIASSGIKVDYFDQKMGFAKKEQLPLCMNTSTIRFRAIDSRLNMIFFMYYLKSDDFKQQLARQITGSAQLNFGPSHLKKMSVPMPPFALQQQFADFVAQVDKLGFDCYREIVCCNVLFSSMSASLLCT